MGQGSSLRHGPDRHVASMLIGMLDKRPARPYILSMDKFPTNIREMTQLFPDDAACARYLEAVRWPHGFVCPTCAWKGEPYRIGSGKAVSVVLRCRGCKKNASLTAGTVMQSSHTPLVTWFWGAYLMTTQTPGLSALQFQKQLGVGTYETAFQILHKLRAGMVRPEQDAIGGEHPVEVDEVLIGGATRGEGHGVHHKDLVVGAVEVRTRKDGEARAAKWKSAHDGGVPSKLLTYAGRLRLRVVSARGDDNLTRFVAESVLRGSTVRTDGWQGYNSLAGMGFSHDPLVLGGDHKKADEHLPMIHLIFSNLKTWINGTHHGRVETKHLQAYLNEFVFRFNRRFYPMTSFHSVLGIAARTVPPTGDQLYSGDWHHPTGPQAPVGLTDAA